MKIKISKIFFSLFSAFALAPIAFAITDSNPTLVEKTKSQYKILSEAIHSNGQEYGKLGGQVLLAAYTGLLELHKNGKAKNVELADLWIYALHNGLYLFELPDRLWGSINGNDPIIGPWALSGSTISDYGPFFGVESNWPGPMKLKYLWKHPEVQAEITAALIDDFYNVFDKRSPYGLEAYFDLEGYLKGRVGHGAWDKPTFGLDDMKQSGFDAKQILLGNKDNVHGLLYWLWVLKDEQAIKKTLDTWEKQIFWIWDGTQAVKGKNLANFALKTTDIKFCDCHPEFKEYLKRLIMNKGN